MTQPMPSACQRGHCTNKATRVVHVDYPVNPVTGREAFRWSKPMCADCEEIERRCALFVRTVVTSEALSAVAA